MSLSLEDPARVTQLLPDLPVELVENIVQEACRTLDVRTVSSIALTSHLFRLHANTKRFTSLSICFDVTDTMPDRGKCKWIQTLADIMKDENSLNTMTVMTAFATSFSLIMTGYVDQMTWFMEVDYECLSYILDNLWRHSAYSPSSSITTRSFSMCWRLKEYNDYSQEDPTMDWQNMDPNLTSAFWNLIGSSQITRLNLEGLHNVPNYSFWGSKLSHLRLRNVTIDEFRSKSCGGGDNCHDEDTHGGRILQLESLDVDDQITLFEIEGIVINFQYCDIPDITLPHLTKFSLYIANIYAFESLNDILQKTPALQCLHLTLGITHDVYHHNLSSCNIHYNRLAHLTSISFFILRQDTLSLVSHLLTYDVPPNLHEVWILLQCSRYDPSEAIKEYLRGNSNQFSNIDNHLIHPSFDSIQRVIIGLKINPSLYSRSYSTHHQHSTEWKSYIRSQIPLLLEKKPRKEVQITIVEDY